MTSLRILVVAGTRPEGIKLAPVLEELRARGRHEVLLGVSAQHRDMLDQVLEVFGLEPDFDLDLMQPGQDLFALSARVLTGMRAPLERLAPDLLLVQGDTTTVFITALAAYYLDVAVGHVEAGLRTGDPRNPFPEELNRALTTRLARLHFAPTLEARANLLREGVDPSAVVVTGNTSIDAALRTADRARPEDLVAAGLGDLADATSPEAPLVLVTLHRRESFGAPLAGMLAALRALAARFPAARFVLPVHPNPQVQAPVTAALSGQPNVRLTPPLPYTAFMGLLARAALVLTDSGGLQEEGPALGAPVLVLREVTERPEALAAGGALLVGTDPARIEQVAGELLSDPARLAALSTPRFPYGRGDAAAKIADAIDARAEALRRSPERRAREG